MSETFNLKWNDFQTNVSKSFGLFRNESYLHDVTLVSEDFKQIPAHKLVLSACSEYFKKILKETKQAQPLLCLDEVNSIDLQNVLDYVYDGEVKIKQEDLDRFLSVAQKLKLEGLINDGQEEDESKESYNEDQNTASANEYDEQKTSIIINDTQVLEKSFHKSKSPPSNYGLVPLGSRVQSSSEFLDKSILDDKIIRNEDNTYSCTDCGKVFAGRNAPQDIRRHVELHIEGLSYPCNFCNKTFRSSSSLKWHKQKAHNKTKM